MEGREGLALPTKRLLEPVLRSAGHLSPVFPETSLIPEAFDILSSQFEAMVCSRQGFPKGSPMRWFLQLESVRGEAPLPAGSPARACAGAQGAFERIRKGHPFSRPTAAWLGWTSSLLPPLHGHLGAGHRPVHLQLCTARCEWITSPAERFPAPHRQESGREEGA